MASDYTPTSVPQGFGAEVAINQNFQDIKTALDAALNRLTNTDNAMGQDFDLGGFQVLNAPAPSLPTDLVRLTDVNSLAVSDVVQNVAFDTTMNIDVSTVTLAVIGLTDNATINFVGTPSDGQPILFRLTQDPTGSRAVTWDASRARFSTDLPFAQSTAANKTDYVVFRYNASDDKFDLLALNKGF